MNLVLSVYIRLSKKFWWYTFYALLNIVRYLTIRIYSWRSLKKILNKTFYHSKNLNRFKVLYESMCAFHVWPGHKHQRSQAGYKRIISRGCNDWADLRSEKATGLFRTSILTEDEKWIAFDNNHRGLQCLDSYQFIPQIHQKGHVVLLVEYVRNRASRSTGKRQDD